MLLTPFKAQTENETANMKLLQLHACKLYTQGDCLCSSSDVACDTCIKRQDGITLAST
jgi:hypothetical protein